MLASGWYHGESMSSCRQLLFSYCISELYHQRSMTLQTWPLHPILEAPNGASMLITGSGAVTCHYKASNKHRPVMLSPSKMRQGLGTWRSAPRMASHILSINNQINKYKFPNTYNTIYINNGYTMIHSSCIEHLEHKVARFSFSWNTVNTFTFRVTI